MTFSRTPVALPVDPQSASDLSREAGDVHYQLIKRAELSTSEVEDLATRAVEVTVLWQRSVLAVSHLSETQDFTLTSRAPEKGAEDESRFVVDGMMLGMPEVCLVRRDAEGLRFVFPAGSDGDVEIDGDRRSLNDLVASGLARPSMMLAGAHETVMLPEGRYSAKVGTLTIRARIVAGGRRFSAVTRRDPLLRKTGVAAVLAVSALLGVVHLASSDGGMLSAESQSERLDDLRRFVAQQAERAEERTEAPQEAAAAHAPAGAAHAGEAGAMGRPDRANTHRRYEIRRVDDRPRLSQQTARQQVQARGIFVAMNSAPGAANNASAVNSMFGEMTASGHGEQNVAGNINGDLVGESGGYAGLDSTGTGWGGGGDGHGTIGTDRIGTQGHGNCRPGEECRFGNSAGTRLRGRQPGGPHVTPSHPAVTGISPEVIRRVVLRNLGQVNRCYEQGLMTNPSLAGRVSVRFVIAPEGRVIGASVADSNLGLPSVDQCITTAVQRWSFALPADSGVVTVTYPFSLMPADN